MCMRPPLWVTLLRLTEQETSVVQFGDASVASPFTSKLPSIRSSACAKPRHLRP